MPNSDPASPKNDITIQDKAIEPQIENMNQKQSPSVLEISLIKEVKAQLQEACVVTA